MIEQTVTNVTAVAPIHLFVDKLPPTGEQWLQVADGRYIVAIVLATVAVTAVLFLAGIHLFYINKYISSESIQVNLYYISLLFPVVGLCSLLAMYMPRCAYFMFTICLVYLMICLMMTVRLMRNLFGTLQALSNYLTESNLKIFFNAPPLCCCCKCCPLIPPTLNNLRHVQWMVVQSPFVRIVLEIISFIAFLEANTSQAITTTISTLEAVSMMVATWGCQILTLLSKERLKKYCFGTVFGLINITQVFFTLQKLIFDLIGQFHGFDNEGALNHVFKAFFWNNFMLCLEMLILSIVASVLISPKRSAIFDKYLGGEDEHREDADLPMNKVTVKCRVLET